MARVYIVDVMACVGERFGIPKSVMVGPSHARKVARPRQMAMALARELTGSSLPKIGRAFNRHHTTALASTWRVAELEYADPKFAEVMNELRQELSGSVVIGIAQQGKTLAHTLYAPMNVIGTVENIYAEAAE
jgi:hypothetical protein